MESFFFYLFGWCTQIYFCSTSENLLILLIMSKNNLLIMFLELIYLFFFKDTSSVHFHCWYQKYTMTFKEFSFSFTFAKGILSWEKLYEILSMKLWGINIFIFLKIWIFLFYKSPVTFKWLHLKHGLIL